MTADSLSSTPPVHRRNHAVWVGALTAAVGFVSYFVVFVHYPALRDVPWVNLPAVFLGVAISALGVHRRRTVLSIAGLGLSLLCAGFFTAFVFVLTNQLPSTEGVVAVGQPAPDFALQDQDGRQVRLSDFSGAPVVVVFYRGHW